VSVHARGHFGVVRSLVTDEPLSTTFSDGVTSFEIRQLGLYEAIALEQEGAA
jgi:hypothetical protein